MAESKEKRTTRVVPIPPIQAGPKFLRTQKLLHVSKRTPKFRLMLCCLNLQAIRSLAFFLSCAPAVQSCRRRYVAQAFLLCRLITNTIDMHHDVRFFSWIFHNHMLGINCCFCLTTILFWHVILPLLAAPVAERVASQWLMALQVHNRYDPKNSRWV